MKKGNVETGDLKKVRGHEKEQVMPQVVGADSLQQHAEFLLEKV